jgi:low temperature requirement protein LtrA
VTTLELFFDLVFAFNLTQLTALLAGRLSLAGVAQVLLIFGLLWWMYGGYTWLTNARPPVHTAERLLLLIGMAGFLVVGLAIPAGFRGAGVELGLGYLTVVLVHSWLYFRVNRNIIRVAPFNVISALLITIAGLLAWSSGSQGPAGYVLWIAAVAIQLGSPLIVHPTGLFELRAAHLVERYSALLLVALGESVAAIGIGAAALAGQVGHVAGLATAALLGLALAAALWWIVFGAGDEDRAERVLAAASSERRTALAMSGYFMGNIPLLLGVVAVALGMQQAVEHSARLSAGPASAAAVLAVGAALFLAGDVVFRLQLRTGPVRLRVAAAVLALATTAAGATVSLDVQLALLTVILVATLVLERRLAGPEPARPEPASSEPASFEPPDGGPAGQKPAGQKPAGQGPAGAGPLGDVRAG